MIGVLLASALPTPEDPIIEFKPLPDPKFFVHFDAKTHEIKSVSANDKPAEGCLIIEVTKEMGEALILGTESLANYDIVLLRNETHELVKRDILRRTVDRVDVVKIIYEINDEEFAPIQMFVYENEDLIEIHYDGRVVQEGPTKFYFTRFNDPAFLKCAFQLDVNTLNHMAAVNETGEWPNPFRLKIDDASDLSVFGIRGQTKASIRNAKARS